MRMHQKCRYRPGPGICKTPASRTSPRSTRHRKRRGHPRIEPDPVQTAMTQSHNSARDAKPDSGKKPAPQGRAMRDNRDERQFGFTFGESPPRSTGADPAAIVRSRPNGNPGSRTSPRTDASVSQSNSRTGRSNCSDARNREPDRSAPDHNKSLGEKRSLSEETSHAEPGRRLASVRSQPVASRGLANSDRNEPVAIRPSEIMRSPVLLLRLREVSQATGLSRNSIYRLESEGQFPRRLQLSRNSVAWCEADVRAWVASRPSGRQLRRTLP